MVKGNKEISRKMRVVFIYAVLSCVSYPSISTSAFCWFTLSLNTLDVRPLINFTLENRRNIKREVVRT